MNMQVDTNLAFAMGWAIRLLDIGDTLSLFEYRQELFCITTS